MVRVAAGRPVEILRLRMADALDRQLRMYRLHGWWRRVHRLYRLRVHRLYGLRLHRLDGLRMYRLHG